MKKYRNLNKAFLLLFALIACFQFSSYAQNDKKEQKQAEIQKLVQSKKFVFVAQYVNPLGRGTRNLTSVYDVKLSKDTIISELPYFGRAYVATLNPSEGGINFTSTKFTYTIKEKKKGGWEISLSFTDSQDVRQMFFTVSEDGYASLQVTSNNREAIGFTGYITSREKFK